VQEASYLEAGPAIRGAWPRDHAMDAPTLEAFLTERTYCVLATTNSGGLPQARPVAFTVFADAIWFGTVAGGRLRSVRRTPWVSVVISAGEGDAHRAVVADGPVAVASEPPAGLLDLWETRVGSRPVWAVAWLELEPVRLFSYVAS